LSRRLLITFQSSPQQPDYVCVLVLQLSPLVAQLPVTRGQRRQPLTPQAQGDQWGTVQPKSADVESACFREGPKAPVFTLRHV